MPLINQVRALKEQGLTDEQIIQNLQEQGFSPLEVNQSIEQANIKTAVSQNNVEENYIAGQIPPSAEYSKEAPMPLDNYSQQSLDYAPEYSYPQQEAYPQQGAYPSYQEYQAYQPATETITEIAEQITEEKFNQIKKELGNISEFKLSSNKKIDNIQERLKKIEEIIERLETAVIGKLGSFSSNIQDIKDEMSMMQDTFSKTLPSLTGKKISKKKKSAIEHYLKR